MKLRNLSIAGAIFATSLFAMVSDATAVDVSLCTEANCSSIKWTLGGQTHSGTLSCSNILTFTAVPPGSYAMNAEGCGTSWTGTVTVSNDALLSLCSSKLGCCSVGCRDKYGTGSGFLCEECLGAGGLCGVERSLGDESDATALYRDFRDTTLRNSLMGRGLIGMYYDHKQELTNILGEAPELQVELTDLLTATSGAIAECMNGETPRIDKQTMARAEQWLSDVATLAHDRLAKDIDMLKTRLRNRSLIQKVCR